MDFFLYILHSEGHYNDFLIFMLHNQGHDKSLLRIVVMQSFVISFVFIYVIILLSETSYISRISCM